jgi:hypothetical protein
MAPALAHLASVVAWLPLALDGEAETAGNTGLGIISVVFIALGWIGLLALWYFALRDKSRSTRDKDSAD